MDRPTGATSGKLAAALLLAVAAVLYWEPIWDIDFWWHVGSGRYLVTQGHFPSADPLGIYAEPEPAKMATFSRGTWLGQGLLYLMLDNFGETGVIALRVDILVACLGLILVRLRRLGAAPWAGWTMALLATVVLAGYTGDRPQLLSFLWAGVAFLVLDRWRTGGGDRWLAALPAIMLLWANSHGGYLLGLVLIVAFLLGSLADPPGRRRNVLIALAATAGAALATPHGFGAIAFLWGLHGSELKQRTSEWTSSVMLWRIGLIVPQAYIGLLLLLSAFGLAGLARRRTLPEFLVTAVLLAAAVEGYRYCAFLVAAATPYVALGLGRLPRLERIAPPAWLGRAGPAVLGLALIALVAYKAARQPEPVHLPITAAQQLEGISGRLFTTLEWGGYLAWRLGPALRPNIDGRLLDERVLAPYTHMLWATPQGLQWFREQRYDVVVLPNVKRLTGERYTLLDVLERDPAWRLAYRDEIASVYRRR